MRARPLVGSFFCPDYRSQFLQLTADWVAIRAVTFQIDGWDRYFQVLWALCVSVSLSKLDDYAKIYFWFLVVFS